MLKGRVICVQYRTRATVIRADEAAARGAAEKVSMRQLYEYGRLSEADYTAFLRRQHGSAARVH